MKENLRETPRAEAEAPKEELAIFRAYLHTLNLSESKLRGKKILDVGAGSRLFAAHLLRSGLTSDIYSLDPVIYENAYNRKLWAKLNPEIQEQVEARTLRAKREAIPISADILDMVLIKCAPISSFGIEADSDTASSHLEQYIEESFMELLRVLKPDGELRMYALPKGAGGARGQFREAILKKLEKLEKEGYETSIEFVDKDVYADGREVTFERVVVRKPK